MPPTLSHGNFGFVISSEAEGRVEKSVGGGSSLQCSDSLPIDSSTRSLRSLGRNDMMGLLRSLGGI